MTNNYVINPTKLWSVEDEPQKSDISKNYAKGTILVSGFESLNVEFAKTKENLILQKGTKKLPFWLKESIGPEWDKTKFSVIIK